MGYDTHVRSLTHNCCSGFVKIVKTCTAPQRLVLTVSCLAVALTFGTPVLGQEVQAGSDVEDTLVVRAISTKEEEKAFADAIDAYSALAAGAGSVSKCDLRFMCADERYTLRITPAYVQLLYSPSSLQSVKLASFPYAAVRSASEASGLRLVEGSQEASYIKLQRSMSDWTRMAGARGMLYTFPNAQDNPFLPWPPRMPSCFDDVSASFKLVGELGGIAAQIRTRIAPRGYDSLRYFSVPGGFAVATDLERVGRGWKVTAADRWTRGKRGGFGSLYDYWTRLISGEDDRFRVFVFIVTDADIQGQDIATNADLNNWKAKGRPSLSRERAAAQALPGTRVWLYTYEFEASRSKGADLVQNERDPLRSHENKLAVGLP